MVTIAEFNEIITSSCLADLETYNSARGISFNEKNDVNTVRNLIEQTRTLLGENVEVRQNPESEPLSEEQIQQLIISNLDVLRGLFKKIHLNYLNQTKDDTLIKEQYKDSDGLTQVREVPRSAGINLSGLELAATQLYDLAHPKPMQKDFNEEFVKDNFEKLDQFLTKQKWVRSGTEPWHEKGYLDELEEELSIYNTKTGGKDAPFVKALSTQISKIRVSLSMKDPDYAKIAEQLTTLRESLDLISHFSYIVKETVQGKYNDYTMTHDVTYQDVNYDLSSIKEVVKNGFVPLVDSYKFKADHAKNKPVDKLIEEKQLPLEEQIKNAVNKTFEKHFREIKLDSIQATRHTEGKKTYKIYELGGKMKPLTAFHRRELNDELNRFGYEIRSKSVKHKNLAKILGVPSETYILVPKHFPKANNINNASVSLAPNASLFPLNSIQTPCIDNYRRTGKLPVDLNNHVLAMKRIDKDIYVKLEGNTYRLETVLEAVNLAMDKAYPDVSLNDKNDKIVKLPFTTIETFLRNVKPATEQEYVESMKSKPNTELPSP